MLEVTDLFAAYGQSQALHGITFTAAKDETVAIMGRNGMGKTTLFKTLMGVMPAKSGRIAVGGREELGVHRSTSRCSASRSIGGGSPAFVGGDGSDQLPV